MIRAVIFDCFGVLADGRIHTELLEYIARDLKPRYKIGLLSNTGRDTSARLFTPDQLALFDAIAVSGETGHLKPAAEAYEAIVARLDVQPNECVFIDDQERHCLGAKAAGLHAIVYRDLGSLKASLEGLGI